MNPQLGKTLINILGSATTGFTRSEKHRRAKSPSRRCWKGARTCVHEIATDTRTLSGWRGSNPWQFAWKANALPLRYTRTGRWRAASEGRRKYTNQIILRLTEPLYWVCSTLYSVVFPFWLSSVRLVMDEKIFLHWKFAGDQNVGRWAASVFFKQHWIDIIII